MDRIDASEIKRAALDVGFTTVGIAPASSIPEALEVYRAWLNSGFLGEMEYLSNHLPLKESPSQLLENAQSVIAVTLNYYQQPNSEEGSPRISRYALGRDYHKVIRSKLKQIEGVLRQSHPESNSRICVDSAPILDRSYASLAGLGWFGKNTMLIDSRRGSWFFIGLIVTTVPFEVDAPSVGGCGSCHACIEACPTGAIVQQEGRWQVDARKCISYQTIEHRGELTEDLHGWTFGCDVCQEVCPFNQPRDSQPLRAEITPEPDFLNRRRWPTLVQLAQISEPQWDQLTQGSPVRRTGVEGLRRNALDNLKKAQPNRPEM